MLKRLSGMLEARSLLLLAVVWLFFDLSVTGWFTDTTFQGLLGRAVPIGILAAGFTVCLLSGRIDLSVGANFALSGVVFASLQPDVGLVPAILLAVAAGAFVGGINATLVAGLGIDSFIASLGTLLVCRGVAFVISDGRPGERHRPGRLAQVQRATARADQLANRRTDSRRPRAARLHLPHARGTRDSCHRR